MRFQMIFAVLIALGVIAACGNGKSPTTGTGSPGSCTSGNGQVVSPNCGGNTPAPTPTPTAVPFHVNDIAFIGQYGNNTSGVNTYATPLVQKYVSFANETVAAPTATPMAVAICDYANAGKGCQSIWYVDFPRPDVSGSWGAALQTFCNAEGPETNDDCFIHATPPPATLSTRTAGANKTGCSPNPSCINNTNYNNDTALTWWNQYIQGLSSFATNGNIDKFDFLLVDQDKTTLHSVTKANSTVEFANDTMFQGSNGVNATGCSGGLIVPSGATPSPCSGLIGFQSLLIHQSGTAYNLLANGASDGSTRQMNGNVSCNQCTVNFTVPNVVYNEIEFCTQFVNADSTLTSDSRYVPYDINTASQLDAIGEGTNCYNEYEHARDIGNGIGTSIADRMLQFGTYMLMDDTATNQFIIGESYECVTISTQCLVSLVSDIQVWDEENVVPIGTPSAQAPAYVGSGGTINGAGCNSGVSVAGTGIAVYLVPGTCDAGANGMGVYIKCYPDFAYRGVDRAADLCVFMNLKTTAWTYDNTKVPPGFTAPAFQYLPLTNTDYLTCSTIDTTPTACGNFNTPFTSGTTTMPAGAAVVASSLQINP